MRIVAQRKGTLANPCQVASMPSQASSRQIMAVHLTALPGLEGSTSFHNHQSVQTWRPELSLILHKELDTACTHPTSQYVTRPIATSLALYCCCPYLLSFSCAGLPLQAVTKNNIACLLTPKKHTPRKAKKQQAICEQHKQFLPGHW